MAFMSAMARSRDAGRLTRAVGAAGGAVLMADLLQNSGLTSVQVVDALREQQGRPALRVRRGMAGEVVSLTTDGWDALNGGLHHWVLGAVAKGAVRRATVAQAFPGREGSALAALDELVAEEMVSVAPSGVLSATESGQALLGQLRDLKHRGLI
jgi:hypothetical protein